MIFSAAPYRADQDRERDSQGVEKSHIFAWTRPPRVMEALR
jgi:hypothetical protein